MVLLSLVALRQTSSALSASPAVQQCFQSSMSYRELSLQGPASAPPALRPAMSDPIERSALGLRRRKSTRISDADAATAAVALAGEPSKLLLLFWYGRLAIIWDVRSATVDFAAEVKKAVKLSL